MTPASALIVLLLQAANPLTFRVVRGDGQPIPNVAIELREATRRGEEYPLIESGVTLRDGTYRAVRLGSSVDEILVVVRIGEEPPIFPVNVREWRNNPANRRRPRDLRVFPEPVRYVPPSGCYFVLCCPDPCCCCCCCDTYAQPRSGRWQTSATPLPQQQLTAKAVTQWVKNQPTEAGQMQSNGERLFRSRCPLSTIPEPDMAACVPPTGTSTLAGSTEVHWSPHQPNFPARIRVPFDDGPAAKPTGSIAANR